MQYRLLHGPFRRISFTQVIDILHPQLPQVTADHVWLRRRHSSQQHRNSQSPCASTKIKGSPDNDTKIPPEIDVTVFAAPYTVGRDLSGCSVQPRHAVLSILH